ncbi:MAG: sulfotransferase [Gammaproteobacteria bacterium]|nr:sulfotransferase [Gammaproteobacteria bacterium]
MDNPNKVVIIVGPARSGTTFLASLIQGGSILYLEEPNLIWSYRNYNQDHDQLNKDDARNEVTQYIRKRFFGKLVRANKEILLEKTPATCLRLPFVEAIFPEAKYIFLERDVCQIANSAERKWLSEIDSNTKRIYGEGKNHRFRQVVLQAKKLFDAPLVDWVHYGKRIFSEMAFMLFGVRRRVWGPRYIGIKEDLKVSPINVVCKKQAEICLEMARSFRDELPPHKYIVVSYDDLKSKPLQVRDCVQGFMGLH